MPNREAPMVRVAPLSGMTLSGRGPRVNCLLGAASRLATGRVLSRKRSIMAFSSSSGMRSASFSAAFSSAFLRLICRYSESESNSLPSCSSSSSGLKQMPWPSSSSRFFIQFITSSIRSCRRRSSSSMSSSSSALRVRNSPRMILRISSRSLMRMSSRYLRKASCSSSSLRSTALSMSSTSSASRSTPSYSRFSASQSIFLIISSCSSLSDPSSASCSMNQDAQRRPSSRFRFFSAITIANLRNLRNSRNYQDFSSERESTGLEGVSIVLGRLMAFSLSSWGVGVKSWEGIGFWDGSSLSSCLGLGSALRLRSMMPSSSSSICSWLGSPALSGTSGELSPSCSSCSSSSSSSWSSSSSSSSSSTSISSGLAGWSCDALASQSITSSLASLFSSGSSSAASSCSLMLISTSSSFCPSCCQSIGFISSFWASGCASFSSSLAMSPQMRSSSSSSSSILFSALSGWYSSCSDSSESASFLRFSWLRLRASSSSPRLVFLKLSLSCSSEMYLDLRMRWSLLICLQNSARDSPSFLVAAPQDLVWVSGAGWGSVGSGVSCLVAKLLRKTVLLMMSADLPRAMVGTRTWRSMSSWQSWAIMEVTTFAMDCLARSCSRRSYSAASTLFSRPRCFFRDSALERKVKRLDE